MPNDQPEIQWLNEQHWLLTLTKGGKLYNAAIKPDRGQFKILNIGSGSGIWCMQMAEKYANVSIVGTDVSPIQPGEKSKNVDWMMHEEEEEWPFPDDDFDFVHLSLVHGCAADWSKMMQNGMRHLAPGGYVAHQEFSPCRIYMLDMKGYKLSIPSNFDELPPPFQRNQLMEQGGEKPGCTIHLGPKVVQIQQQAG